ncbi:hypothetical protein [Paraburkholderia youngii]|uniref:hypothetical protein n=1 Tax=Paraburkholderia youngii TaxID=2782701 RepID=UPI003D26242B
MDIEDDGGGSSYSQRTVCGQCVDTSQWPTPDEGALKSKQLSQYLSRKRAVSMYLSGASKGSIKSLTSIGAKQAYRLIKERCLATHPDGCLFGWRGLVPWLRINPYRRHKKVRIDRFGYGATGGLQLLLESHPDLKERFDARICSASVGHGQHLVEIRHSKRRHQQWFLDELRALGYEMRNDWPFTTENRLYVSLCSYIDRVLAANPKARAAAIGGPNAVAKLKSGDGTRRPVLRFMQRVEMDAHKLDGRFCVAFPLYDGGYRSKIVHRLWVIVILEVVSRLVLGYYFSMRREVSKDDVLRAIKMGLRQWVPRTVSFSDTPYRPGAGFLSSKGDEYVGLCWDETSVDGALAETCTHVREALRDAVGSVLLDPKTSFSKRRSLDDRPFIETFFRHLAGGAFQRMSNTTGAKVQDRKGRDPDAVAIKSNFQYEYAEELLDVLIANYNDSPHSRIAGRTPLEYARFLYAHSGHNFRRAEKSVIQSIFSVRKLCRVRGGATQGRPPFVEFYYTTYTSDTLKARDELVGSKIWVICHLEDDARVVQASTFQGMPLGILHAAPPYNISPHSLYVRSAIERLSRRGLLDIPPNSDAVAMFMRYNENFRNEGLPVHPAYLEARRILIAASNQFIGETMLQGALQDIEREDSRSRSPGEQGQKTTNVAAGNAAAKGIEDGTDIPLPPPHMTRCR